MEIKIIEDISQIETNHSVAYFSHAYISSQNHKHFLCYQTANIQLMIVVSDNLAISIPRSPFGAFFINKEIGQSDFQNFLNAIKEDLAKRQIKQLVIHQPSEIYSSFVSRELLESAGFHLTYNDINQHIPLVKNWKENLHKMQVRKIQSLHEKGFEFKKMEDSELQTAHQFISACRQAQGLSINIEWDHLKKLSAKTGAYECFGVFRGEKLSSVCITVKVSPGVVYYYLPATSPTFRTESPMVMLIEGMVDYYMRKGYVSFDMGVSSLAGKPQDSLLLFKDRMGAIQMEKPTYALSL